MAIRRIPRFSRSGLRPSWQLLRVPPRPGIWSQRPNCTPRTPPPLSPSLALSPAFRAPASWCRRSLPRHCGGTAGIVLTRRRAITVWSCVTTAWPNAGWSCRHKRPWSAPRRASPKHSSVNGKPSTSTCCTCMPNVLRRLRRRKPHCRRWPHRGAIINSPPARSSPINTMQAKGGPPPRVPSRRLHGRFTLRSDPLRRSLRLTSNRVPALSLAPIFQPATCARRR